MTQLVGWFSSNTATLSILGAAVAFIWSTILQISQRKAEAAERQFQAFHKVITWVVAPERVEGLTYVDKQAAAIFELRHFPRYYNFTERRLVKLKRKWQVEKTEFSDALIEEIDLTLEYIQQNR